MRFVVRLLVLASLAAALLVPAATAADRMWVGFHDDPDAPLRRRREPRRWTAHATNESTILRTLVDWTKVAPTRPAHATDPFDPAYQFDDVDEFVRNAQQRGLEVLITLWGTPGWANGGQKPQAMPQQPRRLPELRPRDRVAATRAAISGYPFVRFFSIWNESNLATFLVPQFNARGRIVSPRELREARARPGSPASRPGNRQALVAIGETSSNGRDRKRPG